MSVRFDLSRFIRAQAGIYPQALAEIRAGAKRTHWMWFVFPQILGLGLSENARLYAISGKEEAKAYLTHELLGPRLEDCTLAVLEWAGRKSTLDLFGPIDALKFRSSMTLFAAIRPAPSPFVDALGAFHGGEADRATLARLGDI